MIGGDTSPSTVLHLNNAGTKTVLLRTLTSAQTECWPQCSWEDRMIDLKSMRMDTFSLNKNLISSCSSSTTSHSSFRMWSLLPTCVEYYIEWCKAYHSLQNEINSPLSADSKGWASFEVFRWACEELKTYEVTVGAFPSIQIKIDGTILVLCVCPGQQHSKD